MTDPSIDRLLDALRHIHEYAKSRDLEDGKFIERCAFTALAAADSSGEGK